MSILVSDHLNLKVLIASRWAEDMKDLNLFGRYKNKRFLSKRVNQPSVVDPRPRLHMHTQKAPLHGPWEILPKFIPRSQTTNETQKTFLCRSAQGHTSASDGGRGTGHEHTPHTALSCATPGSPARLRPAKERTKTSRSFLSQGPARGKRRRAKASAHAAPPCAHYSSPVRLQPSKGRNLRGRFVPRHEGWGVVGWEGGAAWWGGWRTSGVPLHD